MLMAFKWHISDDAFGAERLQLIATRVHPSDRSESISLIVGQQASEKIGATHYILPIFVQIRNIRSE
jgi:hypothetical protein